MRRRLLLAMVLVLSSFLMPVNSYADEKLTFAGQDDEGSYVYDFKEYGSFTTSIKDGETAEVAYVETKDPLNITVMKDGAYYESDDFVFYENGNYVLMIYSENSEDFTTFSFKISNNIFKSESDSETETEDANEDDFSFDFSDDFSDESMDSFDLSSIGDFSSLLNNFGGKDAGRMDFDFGYSRELEEIVFSYEGKDYFVADVPNNACVTGDVHVAKTSSNFNFYYYYNDEVDFSKDDAIYSEPGTYDFVVYVSLKDGGMGEFHYGFTIMEECVNDIDKIVTPEGFELKKATRDGFDLKTSGDFVSTDEDGYYSFTYVCKGYRGLSYNLSFTKDTVPPELIFSEDINAKKIRTPLSYSLKEPDCTVKIQKDGYELNVGPDTPIYTGGYFFFTVTDKAGNSNTYSFYARTTYTVGKEGLILAGIFVVLVAIYMFLVRRASKYGV